MPGGAAGLQNQSGGRKVPGGFDSLPSPPKKSLYMLIGPSLPRHAHKKSPVGKFFPPGFSDSKIFLSSVYVVSGREAPCAISSVSLRCGNPVSVLVFQNPRAMEGAKAKNRGCANKIRQSMPAAWSRLYRPNR